VCISGFFGSSRSGGNEARADSFNSMKLLKLDSSLENGCGMRLWAAKRFAPTLTSFTMLLSVVDLALGELNGSL